MGFLKNLFGGNSVDFAALKKEGALIIDVRTPGEFKGGHIKGSKNIDLGQVSSHAKKLKKDQVIITCCASGIRSGSAKKTLQKEGFEVYNGGGWRKLQSKLTP